MSISDEDFGSIEGVVATTHQLPDQPVRLARSALELARDQLLAGGVPSWIEHDSRRPLQTTITSAEVRATDDGEYSLVVTMTILRSDYERIGGRTAFSVAFPERGIPGWQSPDQPDVVMLADSYHWSDSAILDALDSFSRGFPGGWRPVSSNLPESLQPRLSLSCLLTTGIFRLLCLRLTWSSQSRSC
jgi:hypothetical protein